MAPAPAHIGPLRPLRVASTADRQDTERLHLFDERDLNDPAELPIEVLCLEDAIVTPRGFVVHDDTLFWDTTYISPAWTRGGGSSAIPDVFNGNRLWHLDPTAGRMQFALPGEIETIDGSCFLFNSEAAMGNFAHFMFDTMLQVPTYREAALRHPMTPLFVGRGFGLEPSRRLLSWSLGSERDWVFSDHGFLRVRKLFVPTAHVDFGRHRISRRAAQRTRALVATALGTVPEGPPVHLHISREDTSGLRIDTRIRNQTAFERMLKEMHVLDVNASRLSCAHYFEMFKRARTILGLHGAGLMNVFLASQGRMIEIAVPGTGGGSLAMVAEAGGFPTARLMHESATPTEVEVDIEAVREAVLTLA